MLGQDLVRDVSILVVVSVLALVANSSAFVWGPNMALLLQKRRPLARSIAYTIGRGLTLTVASVIIVWMLIKTGAGANGLADQVKQLVDKPHPLVTIAIGLAIIAVAAWFYKWPPAFLQPKKPTVDNGDNARIWPAFVMGITILFANILEFAWQSIGLGTAVAGSEQNILVYGLAVILWTTLGTATLWGPALAFMLAPQWATERFERVTTKIPTVKPWQVALPLGVFGLLFAAYGIWMATRG